MEDKGNPLLLKAQQFLETRKHSDNLKFILRHLDDEVTICEAIPVLQMIFSEILKRRILLEKDESEVSDYINYVKQSYSCLWSKMQSIMLKESFCKQATGTLFHLLAQEGKFPICITKKGHYYFPCEKLKIIMKKCFSIKTHLESILSQLDEFTNFIDVVYYFWIITPKLLKKLHEPSDKQISRILSVLQQVPIPSEEELIDLQSDVLLCYSKNKPKFKPKYFILKESIQTSWDIISRWKLTNSTHKKVLILLIENIMGHLLKPILTMDFLMESLNTGGSISLLALQGIFTLVKDYNLEYPNIYGKLYSFFHRSMFHSKFKQRLYILTNIFLSSTHLPETLVASFIKRFARLCLVAPPEDIVILTTFIGNLLIRHPGLRILIQNPADKSVSSDPFKEDEVDPFKTNAIESSLWELDTLQHHVLPKVSKAVSFINKPLPNVEWDITESLETTYEQIYEKVTSKKLQKVSLTFEEPDSLGLPGTNYFSNLWY